MLKDGVASFKESVKKSREMESGGRKGTLMEGMHLQEDVRVMQKYEGRDICQLCDKEEMCPAR